MQHPRASAVADIVVVGSGIVGLGAAYAAVRRGLSVIVVDRTERPVGATIRNFGHLCIGAQTELAREFADTSREIWLRLARDAGFWLRESGTLIAAHGADELAVLERASSEGDVRMLSAEDLRRHAPIRPGAVVGGAHIDTDLQTHPREAANAIVRHLTTLGVDFRFRTAVTSVSGIGTESTRSETARVETTRGAIDAGQVIVATGHDIDQLLPELSERTGVVRCTLDMMRISATMPRAFDAPVLTGWSLLRYGRFAAYPETAALRDRLHAERPDLAALDLNQMYTQLPDGSLILGDSHVRGIQPSPFQPEVAFDAFLEETRTLFDVDDIRVIERWQGVYASGPDAFLREEPEPGLHVIGSTTGIGMTCGLGLAEHTLRTAIERAPQSVQEGAS